MMRLKAEFTGGVIALLLVAGLVFAPGTPLGKVSQAQVAATPRATVAPTKEPAPETAPSEGDPVSSQLDLALVVDREIAAPGDVLRYQMQVDNVLGQEATNVWLTCDLPAELQVDEVKGALGEVHRYDKRVAFEVGRLQPSFESHVFSIVARVRDDAQPGAELLYRANLTSDQAGGGERSVTTVIQGDKEPVVAQQVDALPTTGAGSVPWWLVVGFGVLIVMVALFSTKGRIHPLH